MNKELEHTTYVTLRVRHDKRFNGAEGIKLLATMVAQRAHNIEGVGAADAEAFSQSFAAGEGEVASAFVDPAAGARWVAMINEPYRQGVTAGRRGQPKTVNPYPEFTMPALLWAHGHTYAMMESGALGLTLDASRAKHDTDKPPRLHLELMAVASAAPELKPNPQVPNAKY